MLRLLVFTPVLMTICLGSTYAVSRLSWGYYKQLQALPYEHVSDVGKVCERVAEIQLQKEFPLGRYLIVPNVVYETESERENRVRLGELDIVVVNKADSKVVLVAEVKCWENRSKAARKARKQLDRFQRTISDRLIRKNDPSLLDSIDEMEEDEIYNSDSSGFSGEEEDYSDLLIDIEILADIDDDEEDILEIYSDDGTFVFADIQFDNKIEYRAISPLQSDYLGIFFHPLDLSLKEINELTLYLRSYKENPMFVPKKSKRAAKGKIKRQKRKKKRH